ncbi:hypothetical protein FNJ84_06180 [Paracoccus sp. M683]|uniref:hypothetical protein n=1 Tax=Paracoccus sp. M683 TaxID=2594268 RepID=UPI00117FC908|nr:hypothetical protein [Paracoccus sp. M683]TRW98363.1 hypothetical protein FNJ84_06180 [Paracoccus sp. M683]
MYRFLIAAAATTALSGSPLWADDTVTSGMIARQGLTATLQHLRARPPGPDRDMALAATGFLTAIQSGYQSRWQYGNTSPAGGSMLFSLPVIDTTLPPNPDPQPMPDTLINGIMGYLAGAMPGIRDEMPQDAGDGALVLRLDDLWFDGTLNGERDPGEDLRDLLFLPLPDGTPGEIRFDAADLYWLRAYTHMVEGMAQAVLAFDPQPEVAAVMQLRRALADQQETQAPESPEDFDALMQKDMFERPVDTAWIILQTLRHQPDAALIDAARANFRAMIAANRDFWQAVATETDNDREWIPNDTQKAVLGFELPPGTGTTWLAVLDQADMILTGERLIPHWRFGPGYGIDLGKWLDAPVPVDLLAWMQGSQAMTYAREGEVLDGTAWRQFNQMFGGSAGLYMVLLN